MSHTPLITSVLQESIRIRESLSSDPAILSAIAASAEHLVSSVKKGGSVFACGNGGSACDAMHFVEELVARYKRERPGIRAQHFMDASTLTCWGNDYSYESIFERQAETFCTEKDIIFLFSTSGNSENVIRAANAAKKRGTKIVGLLGKDGGKLAGLVDVSIVVPSTETDRIQEVHITLVHILCEILETSL